MREREARRLRAARKLGVPLWTVDADVIVPSKLLSATPRTADARRVAFDFQQTCV